LRAVDPDHASQSIRMITMMRTRIVATSSDS
jgi:hypothetical protein